MIAKRILAACLLLSAVLPASTLAQSRPCAQNMWTCFGMLEQRVFTNAGPQSIRMVLFVNYEFLVETDYKGIKKRLFMAQPSKVALYSGLAEDESPGIGNSNSFRHFDQAFIFAIEALRTAYPGGPQSAPAPLTDKKIMIDNMQFILQTSRQNASRIAFRLVVGKEPADRFKDLFESLEGTWDAEQSAPLSEDFDLRDWKHEANATFKDLREARAHTGAPREK